MDPVAFTVFGLTIQWYGVIISLGALLGIYLAKFNCKYRDIDYENILDGVLIGLPCGIIGARLYYVLFKFSYYSQNPAEILNTRGGGLAIHGGIIFGALAAYIYTRRKKINFFKAMDIAVPSIILGQAIGRWGNFFNQEAHGGVVSEAFISKFPTFIKNGMFIDGAYYHPTFLYESIWNLIVFFILLYIIRKVKTTGVVVCSYIGLYSLGRLFVEGLRTDSLMFLGLRTAQIVSILGIAVSIIGFAYISKINNKNIE